MKKIILCGLLLSLIPAVGDDAAPTNTVDTPGAAPAESAERDRALEIRAELVAMVKGGDTSQADWDAADAKVDGYQKEFGVTTQTTNNVVLLRKVELAVAKRFPDPARYQALVKKLLTDPLPEVADVAKAEQAKADLLANLKTQPVDLKYTAVDGTAVDLSTLRGKVVLVDFWATWCPPCREEVPNVVAAYKKYHDQGLEIVGVSLDQDKDAMLAYMKDNGMVWPQYFDGKGWNNEVSRSFDINSIPAMWLVDKKGMLITMNAREDLAGQVEKALQAP